MRNRHQYPIEWYDTIRPNILKRDSYKCKECSIKHRVWVCILKKKQRIIIDKDERNDYIKDGGRCYQIILHVCHLDNNKDNVKEDNLITLCVTCHAIRDGGYKAMIRKGKKIKQVTIFDVINEVEKDSICRNT